MSTVTGIILATFANLCTLLQNLVAFLVTLQGFAGGDAPDKMRILRLALPDKVPTKVKSDFSLGQDGGVRCLPTQASRCSVVSGPAPVQWRGS